MSFLVLVTASPHFMTDMNTDFNFALMYPTINEHTTAIKQLVGLWSGNISLLSHYISYSDLQSAVEDIIKNERYGIVAKVLTIKGELFKYENVTHLHRVLYKDSANCIERHVCYTQMTKDIKLYCEIFPNYYWFKSHIMRNIPPVDFPYKSITKFND